MPSSLPCHAHICTGQEIDAVGLEHGPWLQASGRSEWGSGRHAMEIQRSEFWDHMELLMLSDQAGIASRQLTSSPFTPHLPFHREVFSTWQDLAAAAVAMRIDEVCARQQARHHCMHARMYAALLQQCHRANVDRPGDSGRGR